MSGGALVVTGASGHLGRAVAHHLARLRGGGAGIVLTSRRPAAVADAVPGAQVRYADFADRSTLADAFRGAGTVLIISTDDIGGRAAHHRHAIDAARRAGAEHVLYTSMLSPVPANPAIIAPSHHATEQHLREADVDYTVLRAGFYADFQAFEAMASLASGRLVHNRGDGRASYLSRDDVARAAAAALASGQHRGETLELTGTEAVDVHDLARMYGRLGARLVDVVEVDDARLRAELSGADDGHSQYGIDLTVSIGQGIRAGFFDIVTDSVRMLTGQAPEPLRDIVARDLHALRAS